MDYGYPQFTEARILSEYIKTDAYRMEVRIPRALRRARRGCASLRAERAAAVGCWAVGCRGVVLPREGGI